MHLPANVHSTRNRLRNLKTFLRETLCHRLVLFPTQSATISARPSATANPSVACDPIPAHPQSYSCHPHINALVKPYAFVCPSLRTPVLVPLTLHHTHEVHVSDNGRHRNATSTCTRPNIKNLYRISIAHCANPSEPAPPPTRKRTTPLACCAGKKRTTDIISNYNDRLSLHCQTHPLQHLPKQGATCFDVLGSLVHCGNQPLMTFFSNKMSCLFQKKRLLTSLGNQLGHL